MRRRLNVTITGGHGDISQAIAQQLGANEYDVKTPGRAELDVTRPPSVTSYFSANSVDVLINNAGYIAPAELADLDLDDDLKTIDVNLLGVMRCTAAAQRQGGSNLIVINVGSSAGTKARGAWGAYCASKAALIMLTECWAIEGIQAICVSPGRTATKMRTGLFGDEDASTLLEPLAFARIVQLAIEKKMPWGSNINVNVDNVEHIYEKFS